MSNIVPIPSTGIIRRESRAESRAIARLDRETVLRLAALDRQTELRQAVTTREAQVIEHEVVEFGRVARTTMQEVAITSQLEQQLSSLVPFATTRLQGLGDLVALVGANFVANAERRLSR